MSLNSVTGVAILFAELTFVKKTYLHVTIQPQMYTLLQKGGAFVIIVNESKAAKNSF